MSPNRPPSQSPAVSRIVAIARPIYVGGDRFGSGKKAKV